MTSAILAALMAVAGLTAVQSAAPAEAVTAAQWDPGNIISNGNFYNAYAMTEAEIQSFLDAKIGTCANSNCLNVLRVATTSKVDRYTTAGSLICTSYAGASSERASAILFKVQQACGISAKVLLVTLQKEQSLVTAKSPTDAKLSRAMGYGCPDTTGGTCDSTYYGFFNQVYSAAWQLKRYGLAPYTYNYQPGIEAIRYNPNVNCGATNVEVQNYATAALYNYTPYQPNAAALANLGGTGDACSSYGNRNFWVYYSNWFGSPTVPAGTPEGEMEIAVSPGVISLTGWAIDPDAVTGTVPVSVQVDQNWFAAYANVAGEDQSATYPGAGPNHGFTITIPTTPGSHRVCAYLVNVGGVGGQGSLGCQSVVVPSPPAPVGEITSVTATPGTISFSGWSVRPDMPTAPVSLAVNIGSQWISFTANQPNSTAPTVVSGAGPNQGFSGSFAAATGTQSFCLWAAPSSGAAIQLGCRSVVVPTSQPTAGALQSVTGGSSAISVSGWAVWPDSLSGSVPVSINIGANWYPLTANVSNPAGESAVPGAGAMHGYQGTFPVAAGTYNVCAWAIQLAGGAKQLGCQTVTVAPAPPVQFAISSITGGVGSVSVAGWAVWPSSLSASVPLAVNIGSGWYPLTANQPSTAAETAVPGSGPNHGFSGSISVNPGTYSACVWANLATGGATNLGCQTVTVTAAPPMQFAISSITGGVGSVSVAGWAVWPSSLSASVPLAVNIGSGWYPLTANQPSMAAETAVPGSGPNHGFSGSISVNPGTYSACVWANLATGGATNLGCQTVTVLSAPPVQAVITSMTAGSGSVTVSGWAVWPTLPSTPVTVAVNIGSQWTALPSDLPSTAAQTAVPTAGPNQGYSGTVSAPRGTQNVCVWVARAGGAGVLLGCQNVVIP